MNDDWKAQELLDRKSGKVERIYTYKRERCKRVLHDSKRAMQLAGYTLIEKDLRSVITWLREIEKRHVDGPKVDSDRHAWSKDRENYDLIKGLFVAALTFYGKCFAQCEGRRVKLERNHLDASFREMHDVCIKYRNNFAAHSGAAQFETVQIAIVFPRKPKKNVLPKIYHELNQPDLVSGDGTETPTFIHLAEHVRGIVNEKISKLSDKIMQEEVLPKGFAYWNSVKT
jgi:hypothetical protein